MDDGLKVQKYCYERPICTRCMHGNQVEIITPKGVVVGDGATEYHCRCGNYAVVGMKTRWPFVVKQDKSIPKNIPAVKPANNISTNGQSPMQVGESIGNKMNIGCKRPGPAKNISEGTQKEREEKAMKKEKPWCKHAGCDKVAAVQGYCNGHFREAYGITAGEYKRHQTKRCEDPREVATRLKQEKADRMEGVRKEVLEKTRSGTKLPEPEQQRAVYGLCCIRQFIMPDDLYEKIVQLAAEEYRTVDLQVQYLINRGLKALGAAGNDA